MVQCEECVIIGGGERPAAGDLRVDVLHRAEQLECLVDDVRTEVEDDPATLAVGAGGLPRQRLLRLESLEPGLETVHLSEVTAFHQPADGEEVAVPAPVLEDGQHEALLRGLRHQGPTAPGCQGEGLVHDDVQTGVQRPVGEVLVGGTRCTDHDQVVVPGIGPDIVR